MAELMAGITTVDITTAGMVADTAAFTTGITVDFSASVAALARRDSDSRRTYAATLAAQLGHHLSTFPGPHNAFPGFAPVCSPSFKT
jgi:hypothetical protein